MTSLLIWSQLVIKISGRFARLTLFVCTFVASDSSRQTDKMWPIPDTDLPYAVGRRRSDFLEWPTPCTLLALFPKELSCCVTMEISGCYCRNASIIAENICGLINYPDKLFFAFSASSVFRYWAEEGKDPESLEVCGGKADGTSREPAMKATLWGASRQGNIPVNRKDRGWKQGEETNGRVTGNPKHNNQ